eukprot:COSAG04_NODE_14125_length_579_cov_3.633333_1_plen_90_part_10
MFVAVAGARVLGLSTSGVDVIQPSSIRLYTRSSVPAAVDWSRNSTVAMWWCYGTPEARWKVQGSSIVSMAAGGGCLTAISKPPLLPTPGA